MVKLKKIKKWGSRARQHAERAEAAAERAEAALSAIEKLAGEPPAQRAKNGKAHKPAYTAPQGRDALAPAATSS
ncbi:hypothetical protein [Amycolatopsis sp. H20-H5]|uniref:hypothetical protein n=1 Tax=Amycolatopsis sp. H20-H5 TaxID=3046309 RepID=UPI002DB84E77|nr:hypothetical protein [Amycolatopsis sp. H20-H5]MEC3980928.1 hypothetical protein [Amycolatopsis sp. H20-H5]